MGGCCSIDDDATETDMEKEQKYLKKALLDEKTETKDENEQERMLKLYKPTVVCGPSGVGKGTLLEKLKEKFPNSFEVAVSHTTRGPRKGEIDGIHYHFIKKDEILTEIDNNKFVEWANVHGNIYGTSKQSIIDVCNKKKVCLLEIDYQGAISIKKSDLNCNYMFITCPDAYNTLEKRLKGRNTETDEAINKRLAGAKKELEFLENNKEFFDFVLINDNLEKATNEIIDQFQKWYQLQ